MPISAHVPGGCDIRQRGNLKEDENDFYNIFQRYQKAVLELGCSPCRIGGVPDSIAVCMV